MALIWRISSYRSTNLVNDKLNVVCSLDRSTNLVNQMMEKMEKYANNLEDLVRERTQLLAEEKQKTEALLYRMLPEYVTSSSLSLSLSPFLSLSRFSFTVCLRMSRIPFVLVIVK